MKNFFACMDIPDNVCTGVCRDCPLVGDCRYCDDYQTETFERCSDCIYKSNLDRFEEK